MRRAGLVMLAGIALLAVERDAFAQEPGVRQAASASQVRRLPRRAPTRVEVYPAQRYYRECVDWLAVEHRPSGTVITPQMRCRWAVQ
jgi:hypothetical protein